MITPLPQKRLTNTQKTWQTDMQEAVSSPEVLWEILDLPMDKLPAAQKACKLFPLRVPHSFITRMQKGNMNDPLLQQIIPLEAETFTDPNFVNDPVADLGHNPVAGIVHKYHGRVLLIATGACAVHCRYCFRRHFPYADQTASKRQWQNALEYIQANESIHEVILSGGDPLSLSNDKLQQLFTALENIPHVKTIRIHTRQIIVLPSRVDEGLLDLLKNSQKNIVVIVHINHANEFNQELYQQLQKIAKLGVHMLNQSVILKNINDNADTLIKLSLRLFEYGIMPYYLNVLDQVNGASHYAVNHDKCLNLHNIMKSKLSGYLVPKLVYDQASQNSKTWLNENNIYRADHLE